MLYTLINFLVWGLLLALVGGLVGWALRSLKARSDRSPVDNADAVEQLEELRRRLADHEAVVAERDRLRIQVASMRHADSPGIVMRTEVDVGAAQAILGRTVTVDDLTVVEGIGPKIAELCAGIGVTTWAHLARCDVATLRDMLDGAGSGYKLRDPSSWPRQAGMLASGRWEDFRDFTTDLQDL